MKKATFRRSVRTEVNRQKATEESRISREERLIVCICNRALNNNQKEKKKQKKKKKAQYTVRSNAESKQTKKEM